MLTINNLKDIAYMVVLDGVVVRVDYAVKENA